MIPINIRFQGNTGRIIDIQVPLSGTVGVTTSMLGGGIVNMPLPGASYGGNAVTIARQVAKDRYQPKGGKPNF